MGFQGCQIQRPRDAPGREEQAVVGNVGSQGGFRKAVLHQPGPDAGQTVVEIAAGAVNDQPQFQGDQGLAEFTGLPSGRTGGGTGERGVGRPVAGVRVENPVKVQADRGGRGEMAVGIKWVHGTGEGQGMWQ